MTSDKAENRILRVCALYPDLLNIYADRGNIMVFQKRCEWRGIGFQLTHAGLGDEIEPEAHDLFYLGGGQDRDQALCAGDLVQIKKEALHKATQLGAVTFAVCGGYQLLGRFYEFAGKQLAGIELVDLHTVNPGGTRLIGNVAIEVDLTTATPDAGQLYSSDLTTRGILAGFENHGGRTYLGPGVRALGRIRRGHGNNGADRGEGVIGGPSQNVIGTYLHGPLLPKNAWFADWVIAKALKIHPTALGRLDDRLELVAHKEARRAAGFKVG